MAKLLLVALSASDEDAERVLLNLRVARHLDEKTKHHCLFTHHDNLSAGHRKQLLDIATDYFESVEELEHQAVRNTQWFPVGRNRAWQTTARHIEANYKPQSFSGWFWWEPEAVPIRKGWLDTLNELHLKARKNFSGYRCLDSHMHGCGIWPIAITEHCANGGSLYCTKVPFDRVAGPEVRRSLNDLNGYMVSFRKAYGDNLTAITDQSSIDIWLESHERANVLLECSDITIQEHLLGESKLKPAFEHTPDEYPSVTEQTPWPCGIFTFPNLPDICFFNPSIAEIEGNLHLFTRRFHYRPEDPYGQEVGYGSNLAIWRIRPNMTLEARPCIPVTPGRYPGEQWEDPRAMVVNGEAYVSFCTWIYHTPWTIRQSFTKLSSNLRSFDVLWEPQFGGNSPRIDSGSSHEKNWAWFHHEGEWHCSYSPSPHVVFRVTNRGLVAKQWRNRDIRWTWRFGTPRGGTPPVHVPGTGEYLAFFHSSQQWRGPKRRYFMGAFTFESKPPFQVKRVTPEPLLVGSEEDFRVMNSPLVVFPGGALLRGEEWLVTFGLNDEHCAWIKIPHNELTSLLKAV